MWGPLSSMGPDIERSKEAAVGRTCLPSLFPGKRVYHSHEILCWLQILVSNTESLTVGLQETSILSGLGLVWSPSFMDWTGPGFFTSAASRQTLLGYSAPIEWANLTVHSSNALFTSYLSCTTRDPCIIYSLWSERFKPKKQTQRLSALWTAYPTVPFHGTPHLRTHQQPAQSFIERGVARLFWRSLETR